MKKICKNLTLMILFSHFIANHLCNGQGQDSTLKPLEPSQCIKIGANINIGYNNSFHPFVDFFKLNEGWTPINTTLSSLKFDRDGYVTNGLQVSTKFSLGEVPDSMKFTVFWDGLAKDTSKLPISVSGIKLIPNTFKKTSTGGSFKVIKGFDYGYLSIVNSASTADSLRPLHIRNIRVIREGFESTYLANPFNPEFINQILPQSKIMINPGMSNALDEGVSTEWKDRVTPSSFSQLTTVNQKYVNIAYEYGIQLANITGKDLWVNIPFYASQEYVTEMAKLHKNQLNKNLTVYVEYSYELWNFSSGRSAYLYFQSLTNDVKKTNDTMVYLTKKNWKIWKDLFGTESNRVNRVLAGFSNYPPGSYLYPTVDNYQGTGNFEVIAIDMFLGLGAKIDEAQKIGSNITPSQLNKFVLDAWNDGSIRALGSKALLAYSKEAKRANAKLVAYGDLELRPNDQSNSIPQDKITQANMHKVSLEPLFVAVFDTLKKYGFSEFNFVNLNDSKSSANYSVMGGTFTSSTIISNELRTDAKDQIVRTYNYTRNCIPVTSLDEGTENEFEETTLLFPNPTNGSFKIQSGNSEDELIPIECFDSMGSLVFKGKGKTLETLDFLNPRPNGVYNLQFYMKGKRISKKIVKL